MKRIIIICFIGLIVCTAFICPQVAISDYRDSYTGKYFCRNSNTHFRGASIAPNITSDTVSIIITKDVSDSLLLINIRQKILKVKLVNKNLKAQPVGGHYGGKFYAADSLYFNFAPSMALSSNYVGKKK